jgi:hypothetical protein
MIYRFKPKIYRNVKSGLTWRGEYLEIEVEGDKAEEIKPDSLTDSSIFTYRI